MVENYKRVVPIPIGMDYLCFKLDTGIMNQLSPGGKLALSTVLDLLRPYLDY
jgi:hypothetical protein